MRITCHKLDLLRIFEDLKNLSKYFIRCLKFMGRIFDMCVIVFGGWNNFFIHLRYKSSL